MNKRTTTDQTSFEVGDSLSLPWILLAILLIAWAYAAIEPFLYCLFGWGFVWDYNPNYPIVFNL